MKYEFLKLLKDKAFLISLTACLIITVFMSVEKSQPDSQTKYVMEQYNYDTSEAYNDKIKEYRSIADSRSRTAKKAERLSKVNDEYEKACMRASQEYEKALERAYRRLPFG